MTCKEIEQDLALAAVDSLDTTRLVQICEHCRNCPECAEQLQQFELISLAHARVASELDALTLSYNRSPARVSQSGRSGKWIPPKSSWRWLLPIGTAAAAAIAFIVLHRPVSPPIATIEVPLATPAVSLRVDHAPTLAAYRNAIERSGDASLDALLARDAERLLRGAAVRKIRDLRGELF